MADRNGEKKSSHNGRKAVGTAAILALLAGGGYFGFGVGNPDGGWFVDRGEVPVTAEAPSQTREAETPTEIPVTQAPTEATTAPEETTAEATVLEITVRESGIEYQGQPVTLAELEQRIGTIDKSNVFRALMLFREHHLVHAIEGSSDGTKYELCHSHDKEHDDDQHPHFYCEVCQQTYCLDYAQVPEIQLPEGFEMTSANLMLKGICPHCKK